MKMTYILEFIQYLLGLQIQEDGYGSVPNRKCLISWTPDECFNICIALSHSMSFKTFLKLSVI